MHVVFTQLLELMHKQTIITKLSCIKIIGHAPGRALVQLRVSSKVSGVFSGKFLGVLRVVLLDHFLETLGFLECVIVNLRIYMQ